MSMKINKFLVSAYILAVAISIFLLSCCFYPETFQKENQTGENYQTEEAEESGEEEEAESSEEEIVPDEFTGTPSSSVIGKIEVPGQAIDVDVSGNYAYLTNDLGVLYIINIKDKKNPKIIGKCPDVDSANIVIVKDSYAYISYTEWENEDNIVFTKCGFKIIDISDMEHPEVIGNYDTSEDNKKSVYGMYIEGDYAYISSSVFSESKEVSKLEIVDIGDKKNPEMVGSCTVNGSPSSLWAQESFVYMDINIYDWEKEEYTKNSLLKIIDIKDKTNPVVVSSVRVLPNCWGIYVKGDVAYVSSNVYDEENKKYTKSTLQVVDIKDPENPKTLGMCEIAGGAWEIDSAGNFIYVSSLSGGLYAVDVSDSENPGVADSLNTSGASYDITISGNYGYIADGFSGLVIVGLSGGSPKKDKHYSENDQSINLAPEAFIDVFGDNIEDDIFEVKNPVYFSAENSFDPDYDDLTYIWKVNGSECSREKSMSYYFDSPGVYEVSLDVSDGKLASDATETVKVEEEDLPIVLAREHNFTVGIEYTLINNGPGSLKNIECFMKTPQTYFPFQIVNSITSSVLNTDESFDRDWNLLTHFKFNDELLEGEKLTAKLDADITMYELSYARINSDKLSYGKGDKDLETYTKDDLFVDSDNPVIKEAARSVIKNEKRPIEIAKKLYNFVAAKLHYDYQRAEDRNYELMYASEILQEGKGVCADYAILYTALLRSGGIPARLVDGIPVYTILGEEGREIDMGHAWVEVKLPGYGWIPVDITLEDGFMNTNYYLDVATEKGPGYLYENVTMDWSSYFYDGFTFSWDGPEAPDTDQSFVYKVTDLNVHDIK